MPLDIPLGTETEGYTVVIDGRTYRPFKVDSTGRLEVTLDPQTANTVLVGPASGPAADPTFRVMVEADIPDGIVPSRKMKPTLTSVSPGYVSATPNALADIAGYAVTFTPDVTALVKIEVCVNIQNNTDTHYAAVHLYKDADPSPLMTTYPAFVAPGIGQALTFVYYDDNVTAAAHTYKLRWANSHAGDQLGVNGRVYASWWAT